MFRHLINIYRERNLDLQFDAIHVDLESSVHVAIKAVFQDTQIKACCFHLTQAWHRKLASQLITKTKILRLAAGSKCFSQCQPFRQMKLKTALLKFSQTKHPQKKQQKNLLNTSWITTSQPTPSFLHTSGRMQGWEVPLQMPVNLSIATLVIISRATVQTPSFSQKD